MGWMMDRELLLVAQDTIYRVARDMPPEIVTALDRVFDAMDRELLKEPVNAS